MQPVLDGRTNALDEFKNNRDEQIASGYSVVLPEHNYGVGIPEGYLMSLQSLVNSITVPSTVPITIPIIGTPIDVVCGPAQMSDETPRIPTPTSATAFDYMKMGHMSSLKIQVVGVGYRIQQGNASEFIQAVYSILFGHVCVGSYDSFRCIVNIPPEYELFNLHYALSKYIHDHMALQTLKVFIVAKNFHIECIVRK
jgi:hypothetical protein